MFFYQPALFAGIVFMAAGLLPFSKKKRLYYGALFLLTLMLSFWGELKWENVTLFPAALLLMIGTAIPVKGHWERVLLSGLFGGVAAWKLTDWVPLFFEPALPGGLALILFVWLYCKGAEERFCACALGGITYELSFCLQEYFLFSYCRVRLGSPNGVSISAMGLCFILAIHLCPQLSQTKKPQLREISPA